MATLGERIEAIRGVIDERHEAHRRLGLPQVTLVRNMLLQLERTFNRHPVLVGEREPWCRHCLTDWPCEEVRVANTALELIEDTETNGIGGGNGAG